jgi:hypothetical protein
MGQRDRFPKWLASVLIVSILALGVALLTHSMLSLGDVECSLCVEFKGTKACPTAWGPTRQAAQEEAMRTACAQLAAGVTEVLACNRAPISHVVCSGD